MNTIRTHICAAVIGTLLAGPAIAATSSPGVVTFSVTLNDFTGSTSTTSGQRHDTVVWVTKADGTFIKTLWKQGNAAFDGRDWVDHFTAWNTARAGSTAFDGFTGATSQTYAAGAPNNPVTVTWNCKDASNNPVEDGDYKFYVEYAESKNVTVNGVSVPETGPTSSGLTWTKGPVAQTLAPPNEGTYGSPVGGFNFTNLSIVWSNATVPPSITSAAPPSTGSMGTPYPTQTITATGSDPITYSVSSGSLPTGLTLTSGGVLSGTPTVAGTFTGKITASNGLVPNSDQPFSINIAQAIVFTSNPPPANGNLATSYNHTLTVIGTGPVTYSLGSGLLPPGITLSTDGIISGTPTEIGTFTGKIKAHNGIVTDVTQDFSITISLASDGTVTLTATLSDYTGTTSTTAPSDHDALIWVTDASGKFIKTLWKQGKATFDPKAKDWDHFAAWNTARNGSEAFDGFTSATAKDYAAPNSPISVTWNCRDANGNLVDDGDYKFFIQYGENESVSGVATQGPLSSGLTWTKGLESQELDYPAEGTQGAPVLGNNFTGLSVDWDSGAVIAPEIVVQQPLYTNLAKNTEVRDFGSVLMDEASDVQTYIVKNTGSADLSGIAVVLYGANASDFTVVSPPSVTKLAPWTSTSFSVVFKPSATGTRTATLQIISNDEDDSPFGIQLTGTGTPPPAPEIVVMQPAGSSLVDGTAKKSFGTVKLGKSGTDKTFTIKNTGTARLSGLKILKNGANPYDFRVSMLETHSLEPGKSTTFKVSFKPTAKGTRNATIYIMSNDADEDPFSVKLTGEAVK